MFTANSVDHPKLRIFFRRKCDQITLDDMTDEQSNENWKIGKLNVEKTKKHKRFLRWFGQNNCLCPPFCYFFYSLRFYEWCLENFLGLSPTP